MVASAFVVPSHRPESAGKWLQAVKWECPFSKLPLAGEPSAPFLGKLGQEDDSRVGCEVAQFGPAGAIGMGAYRSRMLSSFAYNQIGEQLKAAAYRAGVQVIEVHPAYTSTIGAVNYRPRYGISIHLGAAIVVARRGLHLSERPAARVVEVRSRGNHQVTLPLPVRIRGRHVWLFWSKVASGVRSAGQDASPGFGEHTSASVFPGAVREGLCPLCHLTV